VEIVQITTDDIKAVISSLNANLHILKQLDPENIYLMDLKVDIDTRLISTGIPLLCQLYANKVPVKLEGDTQNGTLFIYKDDYTFINDLRKLNQAIATYIEQRRNPVFYVFQAFKEIFTVL